MPRESAGQIDVRTVVAGFVRSRFRASLRGADLDYSDSLFASGVVDSFGVLELIAFLEDEFRITIDTGIHELIEFDSVDKIAELVERAQQGT